MDRRAAVVVEPRDHVCVHVWHLLAGRRAVVDPDGRRVGVDRVLDARGEVGDRLEDGGGAVGLEVADAGRVCLRDHEGVPGRERIRIEERENVVGLVHGTGRDVVCDDRTEDAVVGHGCGVDGVGYQDLASRT